MKMLKKFAKTSVCVILIFAISACSTRLVTITGIPGTTIYDLYKNEIGKIGEDGTVKTRLDSEISYYLSKAPNSEIYVPFATDIKDNYNAFDNHRNCVLLSYLAGMFLSLGTVGLSVPIFYQKDKPLDANANNDLIK